MALPHAVARFNKRVTNRFIEPIIRRFGRYAVVNHVGRSSGRTYTTPILLFSLGQEAAGQASDHAVVVLTYGLATDWCRNVLVGGGSIESRSGRRLITAAEVVDRAVADPALPPLVRIGVRLLGIRQFLLLSF